MFKLKDILTNGGATLSKQNEVTYKSGYQVSIKDLEVIPKYKLTKKHLVELMQKHLYIGVWIENGKAYIDHSIHINGKKTAEAIGRRKNQISIWDWKNKTAVYL